MTSTSPAAGSAAEDAARHWFEDGRWHAGRSCPHCGGTRTEHVPQAEPMPYHCRACRRYFGVRTGTVMATSKLPFEKWRQVLQVLAAGPGGERRVVRLRELPVDPKTARRIAQLVHAAWRAAGAADAAAGVAHSVPQGRGRPPLAPISTLPATAETLRDALLQAPSSA